MRKVLGWVSVLVVVALGVWTVGSLFVVSGIEQAKYEVVTVKPGYEIRRYAPQIVAQTTMPTMGDTGPAFRAIAGYIFGGNEASSKIAMTTPVLMDAPPASEKIAMTAPVVMGEGTMSFVMPGKYASIADLPKPKDPRVVLVERPARMVAALRFSWYATPSRFAAKAAELGALLVSDGVRATGKPVLAGYNPPFSVPFMKRNEVLIEVEGK